MADPDRPTLRFSGSSAIARRGSLLLRERVVGCRERAPLPPSRWRPWCSLLFLPLCFRKSLPLVDALSWEFGSRGSLNEPCAGSRQLQGPRLATPPEGILEAIAFATTTVVPEAQWRSFPPRSRQLTTSGHLRAAESHGTPHRLHACLPGAHSGARQSKTAVPSSRDPGAQRHPHADYNQEALLADRRRPLQDVQ